MEPSSIRPPAALLTMTGYYNVAKEAVESNFAAAIEVLKQYYTYDVLIKTIKSCTIEG